MLALLRTCRLVASLVALSLALGAAAPAVACGLGMEAWEPPAADASVGPVSDAPCPMHPADSGAPPEREPEPSRTGCCVASTPAAPVAEKPPVVPVAAVAAWADAFDLPRPVAAPAPQPATRPPAPPGPLHLLHGCFLT